MRSWTTSNLRAAAVVFTVLLAACGGGNTSPGSSAPQAPVPTPEPTDPIQPVPAKPTPRAPEVRLENFTDCDELLEVLRTNATSRIEAQADSIRSEDWFGPIPISPVPDLPGAPGRDVEGQSDEFTETNVQVSGVDEADFVETDGERIYLLNGGHFVVLQSWPPQSMAVESNVEIEGTPDSMFVAQGRAVVFSRIWDETGEFGTNDDCYFPTEPDIIQPEPGVSPCWVDLTKVTILDLENEPKVEQEIYFDGNYVAARRHDAAVRVVVRGARNGPLSTLDFWRALNSGEPPQTQEEFEARVEAWKEEALLTIEELSVDAWLPARWERRNGTLTKTVSSCSSVYIPSTSTQENGVVLIAGFDMTATGAEIEETVVLGSATEVYANLDRLVVAQHEWTFDDEGVDRTALHLFGVGSDSTSSTYLGSGYVPGLPHDQFSFDMRGDILRVATTQTRLLATPTTDLPRTTNQIVTTRLESSELQIVGTTGPIAPGERIFAARYIEDRGYLVTFRVIDPLFVVDLSNPETPTVLGELELPGFSDYMQPLGDDHLLTIGQNADLNGRIESLALRIFDVSDDTNPRLAHSWFFYGQGWSEANQNHLAFTFAPERGLLAFPYVSYEGPFQSSLEIFSVDVETGFLPLGSIDHTSLSVTQCGAPERWNCSHPPAVRRGIFIDDFVYSISGAGVTSHSTGDLSTPVKEVPLSTGGQP